MDFKFSARLKFVHGVDVGHFKVDSCVICGNSSCNFGN